MPYRRAPIRNVRVGAVPMPFNSIWSGQTLTTVYEIASPDSTIPGNVT
jgi:hypothetical protein